MLALSSRNQYLTPEWRARALAIPRALSAAHAAFLSGERSVGALRARVVTELTNAGLRIDYVTLAHPDELTPHADEEALAERTLLAVAVFADTTRLIDNVVLGEDPAPLEPHGARG